MDSPTSSVSPPTGSASCWDEFRQLVSERLALDLSRRSERTVGEIFSGQLAASGLSDRVSYLQRLRVESEDSPLWLKLIDELTIAETYFFRDSGQIELLRAQILPELLAWRRSGGTGLRIWSAGCSTGEEPYSLALLLDGLPGLVSVQIVGTDLNPEVLTTARRGCYRERAMRNVSEELRRRYFQERNQGWELSAQIRERVSFAVENLAAPPLVVRTGLDLIVCRNVLIYFEREQLAGVLEHFRSSLREGGYLLTGHGELQGQDLTGWEVCAFESSLIYRKATRTEAVAPPPAPATRLTAPAPAPPPIAEPEPDGDLESFVRVCLDRPDDWEVGREACRQRSRSQPFEMLPRLLEARLARAQGRAHEARKLLQQALYLEPESARAFLELAILSAETEDWPRAEKLREAVLELLRQRPDPICSAGLAELERLRPGS